MPPVTALVVTYNRRQLLSRCLAALFAQTRPPDQVLVVDNASTDGTREYLANFAGRAGFEYLRLDENTGGAGGFHAGLARTLQQPAGWVWLMDDDALPEASALEELLTVASDHADVYGSVAVEGTRLSWRMELARCSPGQPVNERRMLNADALPENPEVTFIPFLGFFIHTDTIRRIGLPDAGFFIAADDAEYCVRARRAGSRFVLATRSRLNHPAAEAYSVQFLGQDIICLRLSPWKRYYDTRNRLLLGRRHYGAAFYFKTLPGSLVRAAVILLRERDRGAQFRALAGGFIDGLLGRKGRRHQHWGLHP